MSRATRWTTGIAVLAGAALVAVLVPSEGDGVDRWYEMNVSTTPEVREALRDRQARRRERVEFERAWRVAVVRERAAQARTTGTPALAITMDPRLHPTARASIEGTARAELRALDASAPRHPIAVLAFADSGDYLYGGYERSVSIPTAADKPCTIVMRFRLPMGATRIPVTDRVLGTCAFYAKFGAPGPGMQHWLLATNHARAGYLTPPAAQPDEAGPIRLSIMSGGTRSSAEYLACAAGRAAGCEAVFTPGDDPYLPDLGSTSWFGLGTIRDLLPAPEIAGYSPATLSAERAPLSSGLLGALASSVGDERFAAIWQSTRSPAEEYERLQGEPLSAWVQRRVRTMLAPYRAGPGIALVSWLLALALIVGSAFLAITRTRRVMS